MDKIALIHIIVGVILIIATIIYSRKKWRLQGEEIFCLCFFGSIIFWFIFFITMAVASPKKTTVTSWNMKPEMMNDKFFVMGSFTMGSGEVKQELRYNAYVQHRDGSIHLHTFNPSNTSLRYSEGKPNIQVIDTRRVSTWWKGYYSNHEQQIILYIPKGSFKPTTFDGE